MARPKPGGKPTKNPPANGKFGEDRVAWARTVFGDFVLHDHGVYTEEEQLAEDRVGETIRLQYWAGGRKKFAINLTTATLAELEALEQFFKYAFDRARPICAERDRVAEEAFQHGDDSYARLYRQVPQFVVRERAKREHDQGVQQRSDGVHVLGTGGDSGGELRSDGDSVAERAPEPVGAQDDDTPGDEPEGLREVGEVAPGESV